MQPLPFLCFVSSLAFSLASLLIFFAHDTMLLCTHAGAFSNGGRRRTPTAVTYLKAYPIYTGRNPHWMPQACCLWISINLPTRFRSLRVLKLVVKFLFFSSFALAVCKKEPLRRHLGGSLLLYCCSKCQSLFSRAAWKSFHSVSVSEAAGMGKSARAEWISCFQVRASGWMWLQCYQFHSFTSSGSSFMRFMTSEPSRDIYSFLSSSVISLRQPPSRTNGTKPNHTGEEAQPSEERPESCRSDAVKGGRSSEEPRDRFQGRPNPDTTCLGLVYLPIRPGVVPGGSMGRQSYGSPMECLGKEKA